MMRYAALSLLFVGLVLGSGVAEATVVVPVTLDDMARNCVAAVRGTVVGHRSDWDAERRRIHSYTEIEVTETLAGGPAVGTRVTVRTLGGVVGKVGMNVSGTARFVEGEEVVVFLDQDPLDKKRFVVAGMSQGKFQVARDGAEPVVLRNTTGLAYARPSSDGTLRVDERTSENQLSLSALRQRIRIARNEAMSPERRLVAPPVAPTDADDGPRLSTDGPAPAPSEAEAPTP